MKKMEEIDENEKIMVCMDPLVLRGAKFCYCCVPSCIHCRLMSKEEYELYSQMKHEEENFRIKLLVNNENGEKEEE